MRIIAGDEQPKTGPLRSQAGHGSDEQIEPFLRFQSPERTDDNAGALDPELASHLGFASTVHCFVENLRRFEAGLPLQDVVDPSEGY